MNACSSVIYRVGVVYDALSVVVSCIVIREINSIRFTFRIISTLHNTFFSVSNVKYQCMQSNQFRWQTYNKKTQNVGNKSEISIQYDDRQFIDKNNKWIFLIFITLSSRIKVIKGDKIIGYGSKLVVQNFKKSINNFFLGFSFGIPQSFVICRMKSPEELLLMLIFDCDSWTNEISTSSQYCYLESGLVLGLLGWND